MFVILVISSVWGVKRPLSSLPHEMLPSLFPYLSASEQRDTALASKSFDAAFKLARSALFDELLAAESGPLDVVELSHKKSLELLHSPGLQRRFLLQCPPLALVVRSSDVATLDAAARAFLGRVHTVTSLFSEFDCSVHMYRLPHLVRKESPAAPWRRQLGQTLAAYLPTYVRELERKFPTHRYLPVHVDLTGEDLGQIDLGVLRNVYTLTLLDCFNLEPTELGKLTNVRSLILGRNEQAAPAALPTEAVPSTLLSLAPLEHFHVLRALRLRNLPISDLTPIAGFTQLRDLVFLNTQVSDLRPLRGLVNLMRLSLSDSPVDSLAGLETLTGLELIDLSRTRVSDLTSIVGHRRLEILDITGTPVSDLMPLVELTNLRVILASNSRVTPQAAAAFKAEAARRGRDVLVAI